MKKSLLTLALVCSMASGAYAADPVTYGGITYTIANYTQATAASFTEDAAGEITIPATFTVDETTYTVQTIKIANATAPITKLTIEANVTSVPSKFFAANATLKEIALPSALTTISSNAFDGCTALETVTFATGSKLNVISSYAFRGCSALTSIDIPASVKNISTSAFQNSGLTSITLPDGLTTLGNNSLSGTAISEIIIPASAGSSSSIGFNDCHNLSKITFAKGCQVTNLATFQNNPKLTSFTVPPLVKSWTSSSPFTGTPIESLTFDPGSVLTTLPTSLCANKTSLKTISLPYFLTTVPQGCFSGCTALTDVEFGPNVTTMNLSAFAGCTALETITLPESLTAVPTTCFQNCTALKSVQFGSKVTLIASSAFMGTSALKSIEIPASVTKIDGTAFKNSDLSEGITFAAGSKLTSIGYSAFNGAKMSELILPNSVTTLGTSSNPSIIGATNSSKNTTLKRVVLPANAAYTKIGANSFAYCTALESVTIPAQIQEISNSAFIYTALSDVELPAALTTIGTSAFSYTPLTEVQFPAALTSIGNKAFYNCSELTAITIGGCPELKSIGEQAFQGCVLSEVEIPANVTEIKLSAFDSNPITSLTLGESLVTIGDNAFRGHQLSELTLPATLTTIGKYAFDATKAEKSTISKLVIPASVSSIGLNAFSQLVYLQELIIDGDYVFGGNSEPAAQAEVTPLTIAQGAFAYTQPHYVACNYTTPPTLNNSGFSTEAYKNSYLIVPTESKELYEAATGWKNFTKQVLTGIEDVATDAADRYVVYDMLGIKRLDTADSSLIDTLPAGLYIVNGRKQLIK
ncbi:MAG: leucine-rich repeat domain-containing protein [Bacteroides sp.]|nr:leucine-rich repeat domain-containing protein [Bacteroides sp.]MCM1096077.1 leucine-rich repeat domain-containing protein [Terasakiella sp.]